MLDYQTTVQDFDLNTVASQYLSGSMQAVNACYECCDRHANSDAIALYWHGKDGRKEQYSFAELKKYSSQFANFLKSQGIGKGDRVSGLLPRTPRADHYHFGNLADWCCLSTLIYGLWSQSHRASYSAGAKQAGGD